MAESLESLYFNPEEVMSKNRMFNMVLSQRGYGKTFGFLRRAVFRYKEKGEKFIYLRRTKEELKESTPELFKGLEDKEVIAKNEFRVFGKNIGYVIPAAKKGDRPEIRNAGFALHLSGAGKVKSVAYVDIGSIIFDEFIPEDGRYLSMETMRFMSLMETIIRTNPNVRIILLANSITNYSKYFDLFGMKNTGQEFIYNRKASILIANVYGEAFYDMKSKTEWGKIIQQTPYASYILKNTAIMDKQDFLKLIKQTNKIPLYNIIFPEGQKCCIYYASNEGIYWADNKPNPDCQTYNCTDKLLEGTYNVNRLPEVKRTLQFFAVQSKLFFRDMNTKLAMEEFLYK